MQEWRCQVNYVFVNVKPMNFFVCQAGAGNLNNNRRKGNRYHSTKAKSDRIRRVIMNSLIESDPGNVYKYMEYMTMLDAAPEP